MAVWLIWQNVLSCCMLAAGKHHQLISLLGVSDSDESNRLEGRTSSVTSILQLMCGCFQLVRIVPHGTVSFDPADRCLGEIAIDLLRLITLGNFGSIQNLKIHCLSLSTPIFKNGLVSSDVNSAGVCAFLCGCLDRIAIEGRRCLDQKELRHFGSGTWALGWAVSMYTTCIFVYLCLCISIDFSLSLSLLIYIYIIQFHTII